MVFSSSWQVKSSGECRVIHSATLNCARKGGREGRGREGREGEWRGGRGGEGEGDRRMREGEGGEERGKETGG